MEYAAAVPAEVPRGSPGERVGRPGKGHQLDGHVLEQVRDLGVRELLSERKTGPVVATMPAKPGQERHRACRQVRQGRGPQVLVGRERHDGIDRPGTDRDR